jgi:hypothetical protein
MKTIKRLPAAVALLLLFANLSSAQDHNIAAFSIWKPKEGQEQRFPAGYQQHLLWHQRSGDKWDWYGWYVISGRNFGQFVDATFDHSWNDFNSPVNPAGDGADNNLHTDPFGDYLMAFKVSRIEEASVTDTLGLRSKFSRLITLKVNDLSIARKILGRLKEKYMENGVIKNFQCFRTIDGGNLYQLFILIGLTDFTQMERSENIPADLAEIERSLKTNVITEIDSELLAYKREMSLIGGR